MRWRARERAFALPAHAASSASRTSPRRSPRAISTRRWPMARAGGGARRCDGGGAARAQRRSRWRSAIGDLAGLLLARRGGRAAVRPRRPRARARARRRDRGAHARRPRPRLRRHRARQAGQPRAQLFVRHRSDPPLRSRDPAAASRARSRTQAAVRIGQRVVEILQKRDRATAMCSASTCGCGRRPK